MKPALRLPRHVIQRSPGLLPMWYTLGELSVELEMPPRTLHDWLAVGMPHRRTEQGRIWVDGKAFAAWVQTIRPRKQKRPQMAEDEAFCFRCHRPVPLINPVAQKKGRQLLLQSACPTCGTSVNRGCSHHDKPSEL